MATYHLLALEHIQNNQWHKAHELIQSYHDELSCLIHGYLHWQEGDITNAHYWYNRANTTFPQTSPERELNRLIELAKQSES